MVDKATKKAASKRRPKKNAARVIAFILNEKAFDQEEEITSRISKNPHY